MSFCLNQHNHTYMLLFTRKTHLAFLQLLLTHPSTSLQYTHNTKRSSQMLSSQRSFILVRSDQLRNIVDIMSGRVRIYSKSVQIGLFWHLSHKCLQPQLFLLRLLVLMHWPQIKCQLIIFYPLLLGRQFLFFFFFLLEIPLHVCDFCFN